MSTDIHDTSYFFAESDAIKHLLIRLFCDTIAGNILKTDSGEDSR